MKTAVLRITVTAVALLLAALHQFRGPIGGSPRKSAAAHRSSLQGSAPRARTWLSVRPVPQKNRFGKLSRATI